MLRKQGWVNGQIEFPWALRKKRSSGRVESCSGAVDLRPTKMTQLETIQMKQHSFSIEGCKQTKLTQQCERVRMVRCLLCSSRSSRRNRGGLSDMFRGFSCAVETWMSGGSLWVAFPGFFGWPSRYFRMTWRICDVKSLVAKLHGISAMFPIPSLQNLAGHCMMPRGSKRSSNKN